MKVVVQRSKYSKVTIDNKINGEINKGYVLLTGFTFGVGKKKKPVVLNDLIRKTFQFNFDEIEANTSNIFHKTPPETEEEKDKKK